MNKMHRNVPPLAEKLRFYITQKQYGEPNYVR